MLMLKVQVYKTLPVPNRFDIVLNPDSGRFCSPGTATAVEAGKSTFWRISSSGNATVVQVVETVEALEFLMSGKLVLFLLVRIVCENIRESSLIIISFNTKGTFMACHMFDFIPCHSCLS